MRIKQPSFRASLNNVLSAYSIRNPSIGYTQGFNFIVARLLEVLDEEEAFWVFTRIVECIMPLDYYSNMFGAVID